MNKTPPVSIAKLWKSTPTSDRVFDPESLIDLPTVARRYLVSAIAPGNKLATAAGEIPTVASIAMLILVSSLKRARVLKVTLFPPASALVGFSIAIDLSRRVNSSIARSIKLSIVKRK